MFTGMYDRHVFFSDWTSFGYLGVRSDKFESVESDTKFGVPHALWYSGLVEVEDIVG